MRGVYTIPVSRAYTFIIVNTASLRLVILRNGAGEASFGIQQNALRAGRSFVSVRLVGKAEDLIGADVAEPCKRDQTPDRHFVFAAFITGIDLLRRAEDRR